MVRIRFRRSNMAPATLGAVAVHDRGALGKSSSIMRVHALLLLPTEIPGWIEWQVAARFLLHWQIAYLRSAIRSADVDVTLVCSERDSVEAWTSLGAGAAMDGTSIIRTVDEFDMVGRGQQCMESDLVLLMASPCLTDLALGDALDAHRRSNRSYTVVRARGGQGTPYLCILDMEYAARNWHQLAPTLREGSLASVLGTQTPTRLQVTSGYTRVLESGTPRELKAFEQFWASHIASTPGKRHTAAPYIGATARIAPSAKMRAPVIIGDGVIIGNRSSIGPWVTLDAGVIVGDDCWIDHAHVGTGARLESEACVYHGVIEPNAKLASAMPLLKARLSADGQGPVPQRALASQHALGRWQRLLKRLFDVTVAGVGLLILLPLLLVIAVLCSIFQGWPVLFRHERLGQNSRTFRVFKFRSMHRQSPKHAGVLRDLEKSDRFKIPRDPRVTGLGRLLRKTSLDELPQILNVLTGDMSLIGPRPIVSNEAVRYGPYITDLLRTLPGVTGLWQVSGRSNTTYQRRIMLDVKYGDMASIWQDVKILCRTIPAVLLLRGAE